MRLRLIVWFAAFVSLAATGTALAQDALEADVGASGGADIEGGATEPSNVELGMSSRSSAAARRPAARAGSSDVRLGLQLRLNAVNVLAFSDVVENSPSDTAQVPFVTPGVRFLDNKLFLGIGLGFNATNVEEPNGDEQSRSGFTVSPLASYDVLLDESAALSLLGWLNLSSLGESEDCDPDCTQANDDEFGWGLNLGAGVRGLISPGLAIGGEFGWGFLNISADAGDDVFDHGIFGNLLFEATVGL